MITNRLFCSYIMVLLTMPLFGSFEATSQLYAQQAKPKFNPTVYLERVEKIYSDGKWNGRLSVVSFKGRYYIFFRSAVAHDQDGAIRMIRSAGGKPRFWSSSNYAPANYAATIKAGRPVDPIGPGPAAKVIIDSKDDESEMHVLATRKRMFGYVVMLKQPSETVLGTQVIYTDDGTTWSKPKYIYKPGWSLWKPRTYKSVHYVVADVMTKPRRIELLRSTDGIKWIKVSTIKNGPLTETDLVFLPDGTCLAIARQGHIFRSKPPYTNWTEQASPHLGGPAAAFVGNTILVSGRAAAGNYPDDQIGERRNVLFAVNPKTLRFRRVINMVTQWGGDVGYPHILPIGNKRALMAWYDGQHYKKGEPKQADIFLAILKVK